MFLDRLPALALRAFVGVASLSAPQAFAALVYFNDFQGTIGSEWSHTNVASAPNPDYAGSRLFLGEFGNETVSLSLGNLPVHHALTLSFELNLIRSWDGNATEVVNGNALGPDTWQLGVRGGPTLLNATFSNGHPAGQSYDGAFSTYVVSPWTPCNAYAGYSGPGPNGPMTGANECFSLGYTFTQPDGPTEAMDSVYNLSFTFAHAASDVIFDFSALGLQGLDDESWGLDNVRLELVPVPLPAAALLFGSGLLGLTLVGRRR